MKLLFLAAAMLAQRHALDALGLLGFIPHDLKVIRAMADDYRHARVLAAAMDLEVRFAEPAPARLIAPQPPFLSDMLTVCFPLFGRLRRSR